MPRELAVVTGASTGIGYELAKQCAEHDFDLIIVADEPEIEQAADECRALGARVETLQTDLSTEEGVQELYQKIGKRPVGALLANVGIGLGRAFLDQDLGRIKKVIATNITGTVSLVHKVGRDMRARNAGRILFTGSIAGFMPGTFQAVYNGTKAFIDSFSEALRNELKDTDVTVTCLMPGPTDTKFFERADMMDTKVGVEEKEDPAVTAKNGFQAMMKGKGSIVSGWGNKMQVAMAHVTPAGILAEQHRKMAEPGTAKNAKRG
jgi:short-subunit dehydrogenase